MDKLAQELKAEIDKIDFDGGLVPSTPAPAPAEPAAESEPTSTPETPVAEPAAEPAEPTGTEPATPEPASAEPADKAIPDSHYRAALHMGWKPEEIGTLYDQNPDLALKTLAKCHEQVNATSRQLGELGQKARQLKEQSPAAVPAAQPQASRKDAVMRKLKEKYEDDPIIDILGELIPEAPVTPTPQVPVSPPTAPAAPQQFDMEQAMAQRQQINNFFGADEMGVYADFYGKTSHTGDMSTLTPGQRANRIEVLNTAQNILDGAAFAGMPVTTAQALEQAHLIVAAPIAEQMVRNRIVKSVQKRAAGITLKPSGSQAPAPAVSQYNHQQAVADVAAEIKKIGLG